MITNELVCCCHDLIIMIYLKKNGGGLMRHKLALIRGVKGYTQQEVSNRTGYTQGQISRWENGHSISLETAVRLSEALEVSLDDLICKE